MPEHSRLQVGTDLFVVVLDFEDLKEQDVNAQVMSPKDFDRLTENIRTRGALESLPFCAQPGGQGEIQIVSGHHRVRAALAAGLTRGPVLLDTSLLTRSQIVAKQIAHNQLVGTSDEDVLKELLRELESVDDWLETGLPQSLMPGHEDRITIDLPHADFDWRTVTIVFLPRQLEDFKRLLDSIAGHQDLVVVAEATAFSAFARATSAFSRLKEIRTAGTAIALLTEIALQELKTAEGERNEADK